MLNRNAHQPHEAQYVLYWVRNALRTTHNPTLEAAAHAANQLQKPLRALYVVPSSAPDGHPLTERHVAFLVEALQDFRTNLAKRSVPLAVIASNTPDKVLEQLANDAVHVFTDAEYLRQGRVHERAVESRIHVPLTIVEANVVVPVEVASNKSEHAARTIRPKITSRLDQYLVPLQTVQLEHQEGDAALAVAKWIGDAGFGELDIANVDHAVQSVPGLDQQAKRTNAYMGGETEANLVFQRFLKERLREYGKCRNEPALDLQSDLSPYLRIGCISPVDVAMQTNKLRRLSKSDTVLRDSVASFLEELIVRRELSVNMCWFNEDGYDVYEKVVPEFAQISLELHKRDERPKIYSYEQLEAGVTHDAYWNAAQRELLLTGKMHGYMRMYWAKQIIGWVEDPKTALEYALRLNNRWGLDAVDPNSYAGVIWCFGKHDQGWTERPIWGKVRYMNESGLKRKFNMPAYLSKIHRLVKIEGLPPHLKPILAKSPMVTKVVQSSILDAVKRKSNDQKAKGAKRRKR